MSEQLVASALADFNHGEAFFRHLSDDVVLEFPYGPSLGLPSVTVGRSDVQQHLGAAQASGLRIGDPTVASISREGTYFAEYVGTYRGSDGSTAQVPLVAVIEHDGSAITRIREFWDTLRIARLSGE